MNDSPSPLSTPPPVPPAIPFDAADAPQNPETDPNLRESLAALHGVLAKLHRCSPQEREHLSRDLTDLENMAAKLTAGRVEIVIFGEISTGKSALINALAGEAIASVDVRGGWTKEVWHVPWNGTGHCVPGFAQSQLVLVDTPGLNEVGGQGRADIARDAAQRADLLLFVTDSDFNETEHAALVALCQVQKPVIVVLNKIDLYSREQRARLLDVLVRERLAGLVPAENLVAAAADPREIEYVIESPDGASRQEWRKPPPNVIELKARILEVLAHEGLALVALNAALYAADKNDRINALRVSLRERWAQKTIASYAIVKSLAVALNPAPVFDVLGGAAVDTSMIVTLARIYGLEMSWSHARGLVASIVSAAGWVLVGELSTHVLANVFKALTVGYGALLTAIPQGAAAGYGSYIVGQAARYYFEHGASWGGKSAKTVVQNILDETDKQSVLAHLKDEIRRRIVNNPHAGK